jgi:integrase
MKGSIIKRGGRFVTAEINGSFTANWGVADERGWRQMKKEPGFPSKATALAHLKKVTGKSGEDFAWEARWFSIDPGTGRRRAHSKGGFGTRKDAEAHLAQVLAKLPDGSWRPEIRVTVRQLLEDHWLPTQASRGLRASTLDHYRRAVDAYLVPRLGARTVSALTPGDLAKLVEALRTETSAHGQPGLSPRTAQMAVGVLKAATAWGLRSGLLARDPLAGVSRPRVEREPMAVWSADEARRFLEAVHGDRLEAIWALLLTRGPRRGEVCGLNWADLDLEAKTWKLTRTRIVVDGKALDSTPKTAAGRRSIPLDARLVSLLRVHRARQATEKLSAGPAYEDGGWLFADELGRPYYPDSLSTWFDQKVKAVGLPRIRLHDARHTAASLMLASGVPVKVVSELLGHASPSITLAVYAHVLPGMAEEAGAALSQALLG